MEELFSHGLFLMEVDLAAVESSTVISIVAAIVSISTLWLKVSFDSKTKIKLAQIESANELKKKELKSLEHKIEFYESSLKEFKTKSDADHERIKKLEDKQEDLLQNLEEEKKNVQRKDEEISKLLQRIDRLEKRLDSLVNF